MNYNSFVSFVFQNCHVIINLCEEDAKKYIIEKLFCHSLCGQLYHTPNYDWIYFRLYTIWLYTIQVYTIPRFCLPLFKLNEDKNVSSIEVFIMCCIFTFCHSSPYHTQLSLFKFRHCPIYLKNMLFQTRILWEMEILR